MSTWYATQPCPSLGQVNSHDQTLCLTSEPALALAMLNLAVLVAIDAVANLRVAQESI